MTVSCCVNAASEARRPRPRNTTQELIMGIFRLSKRTGEATVHTTAGAVSAAVDEESAESSAVGEADG